MDWAFLAFMSIISTWGDLISVFNWSMYTASMYVPGFQCSPVKVACCFLGITIRGFRSVEFMIQNKTKHSNGSNKHEELLEENLTHLT